MKQQLGTCIYPTKKEATGGYPQLALAQATTVYKLLRVYTVTTMTPLYTINCSVHTDSWLLVYTKRPASRKECTHKTNSLTTTELAGIDQAYLGVPTLEN